MMNLFIFLAEDDRRQFAVRFELVAGRMACIYAIITEGGVKERTVVTGWKLEAAREITQAIGREIELTVEEWRTELLQRKVDT